MNSFNTGSSCSLLKASIVCCFEGDGILSSTTAYLKGSVFAVKVFGEDGILSSITAYLKALLKCMKETG